ncbi:hypothetical protein EU538_11205 [Candidatus Thorarchaeota archaeon]|nr:MAG: hypothetical protein EU538_11205 [Candidatus Thorarchaeota archaeon]
MTIGYRGVFVMIDDSIPEWDISPMVKNVESDAVREEMASCVRRAEEFKERYVQSIQFLGAKELRTAFEELEQFMWSAKRVRNYCWMLKDEDVTDSEAKGLFEYAKEGFAKVEFVYTSFEMEVIRLFKRNPEILDSEELETYRHYLSRMRERSTHCFSDEQEKLILEMNQYGRQAWTELHSEILGSSTRRLSIDDQEKEYSLAQLVSIILNSTKRENRRKASEAAHALIADHRIPLSHAYRAISRSYESEMRRRDWPDVLTYALHREDVSVEALEAMQKVIKENVGILRRYIKVKASLLDVDRLCSWDLTAPVGTMRSDYSWSEARKMVVDAYSEFDSDIGAWVDGLFEKRRIDATPRPGKTRLGGCWFSHEPNTSWITLNFTGGLRDIFTLAHETGHGIHSYLSAQANTYLNWLPGSCMTETASLFGESLLLDLLLSQSGNSEKAAVLSVILDKLVSTVYYSQVRFEFEKRTYDMTSQDRYLDVQDIGMLWKECRDEVFGDDIEWGPNSEWRWAASPNNFRSDRRFYNFPYAFGQLLTYALYLEYKRDGQTFVPKLKKILQSGSAASPSELLREVGFDINSERFWEKGIRYAEHRVEQLEGLLNRESS